MKYSILLLLTCIIIPGCNKVEEDPPKNTTITDIDGNPYGIIQIGNTWWMSENLRTTRYCNGDTIPTNLSNTQWENTTSGAYAIYSHDKVDGINSEEEMVNAYGKLYNWYAVDDPRGICPEGWHVPTNEDFAILINHLGKVREAGEKLSSSRVRPNPHPRWRGRFRSGTNESGFSAFPAGQRAPRGGYSGIQYFGFWWTSTEYNSYNARHRGLPYGYGFLGGPVQNKNFGFSVRCIKE